MAEERDLELLDDYLTNQMSDHERSAFEQKLKADPDLQHEYVMQKRLIQGLKDARIAELKSMLNQVPVPSQGSGNALGLKALLGTTLTLMIAAAGYWFFQDEPSRVEQQPISQTQQQTPADLPVTAKVDAEKSVTKKQNVSEHQAQETDKNQTSAGTEHSKPSLAKRPDPLTAPGAKSSDRSVANENSNGTLRTSATQVTVEQNDARYVFHYRNQDGKVTLYGPFEKDQYEVIELQDGENKNVFLSFRNNYYLLEEGAGQIRSLSPVTDATILQKLK